MKSQFATVVLSVIATLVVLGAGEGVARVAHTVKDDLDRARTRSAESSLVPAPMIGWERKPGFRGDIAGVPREFDSQGFVSVDSAQALAPAESRRVLFFGDSNTFGFGVAAEETFAEQVERRVQGIASINLAVIGYSSHQGRLALVKALPALKPDLVVVSFNFNDRRYVTQATSADEAAAFGQSGVATRALADGARALEFVYLVRVLRSVLDAVGLLDERRHEVDLSKLVPRVDEAAYRRNLTDIAETARRAGVPVLFVLLKDNPLQADHLNRGVAAIERDDLEAGVAYLRSASASHRMFANLARLHLAQALAAGGRAAEAQAARADGEAYRSFSGGTVIRGDTVYNDIMREVARDTGASLVDAGSVLAQHPTVYFDYCHFTAEGHRIVADLIAPVLAAKLGQPLEPAH